MTKKPQKQEKLQILYVRESMHRKLKDFCVKNGYKIQFITEYLIGKLDEKEKK